MINQILEYLEGFAKSSLDSKENAKSEVAKHFCEIAHVTALTIRNEILKIKLEKETEDLTTQKESKKKGRPSKDA
ncbi:hypothetical protein HOE37_06540 [Candidatus Woesearchaeota archaeon]|jgi:hypothetical protein|nr:hypothetical protein [Candidatus Woesearchaeota archaeon]